MKTCSGDWQSCAYACCGGGSHVNCTYQGYCIYQLPNEGEQKQITPEVLDERVNIRQEDERPKV